LIGKCLDNNSCSSLTFGKQYLIIDEKPEYFVVIDDMNEELTCKKNRFIVVQDGGLTKKAKATITELNYQLQNDCKDIKKYVIRKNSRGDIKEISIIFNYD
jgi:hypothetical protein